jgi:hypothetical protein
MLSTTAVDHGFGDPVQHHVPLESVLHVSPRDNEDGGFELRNADLPTPSQSANLVLPCAGIDIEKSHSGEMPRQLREQETLLLH